MCWIWITLIFFNAQLYADETKNNPVHVTKNEFARHHNQLIKILIESEQHTKYPENLIIEGEVSSSPFNLNFFISEAFARGNMCFFGGWPSYYDNGKCRTPWKFQNDADLNSLGPTYNSDHYCGSKTLYRCNPTLFGDAPNGKGLCVELSSYGNYTQKCYEETRGNVDELYEKYKNDESFRNHYQAQAERIKNFCEQNPSYDSCRYLLSQLGHIQNKICEDQRLATLDNQNQGLLTKLLNSIRSLLPNGEEEAREIAQEEPLTEVPQDNGPQTSIRPQARPEISNAQVCQYYNRFKSSGVPEKALKQALTFYDRNRSRFPNKWISIADYTENSRNERFYMFNVETGEMRSPVKVSHGSGALRTSNGSRTSFGDPNHDGELDQCRHTQSAINRHNEITRRLGRSDYADSQTNLTRAGFFRVSEPYYSSRNSSWTSLGSGNNAIRMDGLSGSLNDHARGKGVVMHGAEYNRGTTMGRSWGCPAFAPGDARNVLNTITGGSLYYSYVGNNCSRDQDIVDRSVPGWETICR